MAYLSNEVPYDENVVKDLPESWIENIKTDPHIKFFENRNISRYINGKTVYNKEIVYFFENVDAISLKGIIITTPGKNICGYAALKDERDNAINDGYFLGNIKDIKNTSFDEAIAYWVEELNTCDLCHESVGYGNLNRFSFAGKCCTKCLPAARAKYEQPGWYN